MRLVCALALACIAACVDEAPNVRVETAVGFASPRNATVSVFGAFHDGRMSVDAWRPLSPSISRALGKDACEVAWGDALREQKPDLADFVDQSTRENGITDELLEKVAPLARGDYVMTLVVYRYIPKSRTRLVVRAAPQARGVGRRGGMGRTQGSYPAPEESHVFELSAGFWSVREKKLVAEVSLRYDGDDLDVASAAFVAKLRAVLPGAKCVGWNGLEEPASGPLGQGDVQDGDGGADRHEDDAAPN
ncbi:MAG TPA: hypothetical protein VGH28_21185 [Polyangiaceae bacterium]|jgi:hypothetical protein